MLLCYHMDVAPLEDDELFRRVLATLSPVRREKVLALRLRSSRNESLGAACLLDQCLRTLGLREAEMCYRFGAAGKPAFANRPELHFSLSHSGGMAAAVLSDRPVGCDVQQLTKADPEIARRRFAAEECEYIFSADPREQRERFFRLWALKESYAKATGEGLQLPLNAYAVTVGENAVLVKRGAEYQHFSFFEFSLSAYRLAVCARGEHSAIDIRECGVGCY